MGAYLAALRLEVDRAVEAGMPVATSVFFGGGTPSLVPAHDLMAVLDGVPRAPWAEVTVECNPDTVSLDLLRCYRDHGVSRISLGVQSMVPHVLASLGRTHDPANVRRAVELVEAVGFSSWNLDLIYGGAGESLADWERTLVEALALEPPHVSAYALTVEAGTPLAADPARHPDDDDQADKYIVADSLLSAGGLASYEISNWARPDHECHHNLLYWDQGDYLGFGCAAHSHTSGRRWWNVRTPERYLALVTAGRSAEGGYEELDAEAQRGRRSPALVAHGARCARRGAGGGGARPGRAGGRGRRPAGPHARRPAAGQRGRYPVALSTSSGTGWGGGGPM